MSWLSRVRSGIPFLPKRQGAENLWHKCAKCGTMVFVKEWEENYNVCPRCNFHDRIGPAKRFEQLFDAAEYEVLPAPEVREDPLRFRDTKRYTDRLKAARTANGERDALVNARGRLDGRKVIIGVQDFGFMGGSMGIAVGAAFLAGVQAAIADKAPYVLFTAAGGARMQEGILSLMQMPRTTVALADLKEAGLPYIVVLTDPTTGGVTASYAMLGDVQLAEPGALPFGEERDAAANSAQPAHSMTSFFKLPAISAIARAGSAVSVIGRPMTSTEAPPSIAWRGVTTRFWSAASVPAGRMPGTTKKPSGQDVFARATSAPEQTMPSIPLSRASSLRRTTCTSGEPRTPVAAKSLSSRLVSTVTATILVPAAAAALAPASIARPPAA